MKQLIWRYWRPLLGAGIVAAFLAAAVFVLIRDGQKLFEISYQLNPLLVLLSFIVECSSLLLAVPIWRQIMRRFVAQPVSYQKDFQIYCYSMLGVAIPGRLWSVVGRSALYNRLGIAAVPVAAASVVEMILMGLAGLLVFGVTTAVTGLTDLWQRPGIAIASIAVAFLLIQPPLFNRQIAWFLSRSRQNDVTPVTMKYKDLIIWLLVDSMVIVIGGTAVFILLYSVTPAPLTHLPLVIGAWAAGAVAATLFFWIPGPVIRDGMMTLVLSQAVPNANAILFVILIRVWTIASILLLVAIIWLITRYPLLKQPKITLK